MRSTYAFTLLLLLVSTSLFARQAILKGTLKTADGTAPDAATVQLLDTAGHPLLSAFSDSTGQYTFPVMQSHRYMVSASALGYSAAVSDTLAIDADTISAPVLLLQQEAQSLNSVTITTTKKLYEMKPDKLVMNVEHNPIAAGNSVFQVIRQAPGISTDKDDNLRLKGATAQIYINGRPSFLTGTQLTDYLKNLPADNRAHYLGEGLNIRWRNEWEGRQCHISFSYKFGSQQVKAARERNMSSEERTRIGR